MRWAETLVAFLWLMQISIATAEPGGVRPIELAGKKAAIQSGAILRGENHVYAFSAHPNQTLRANISSLENNAVFQIYAPHYQINPVDQSVAGSTLAGAGEGDDAQRWSGKLPTGGEYLIVVGSSRGNASYKLILSLK